MIFDSKGLRIPVSTTAVGILKKHPTLSGAVGWEDCCKPGLANGSKHSGNGRPDCGLRSGSIRMMLLYISIATSKVLDPLLRWFRLPQNKQTNAAGLIGDFSVMLEISLVPQVTCFADRAA